MNTILTFDSKQAELNQIIEIQKDIIAKRTDDDWDIKGFCDCGVFLDFLKEADNCDLTCIDITQKNGVSLAVNTRKQMNSTLILIISDDSISPVSYMRPDIMAAALLIRPIKTEDAYKAIKELICIYLESDTDNAYVIHNKEGDYRIPYSRITCFEARQKKIYLRTEREEIGFYDTLENLVKNLPDMFVRIHKSFIVNKNKVDRAIFSENIIYMDDSAILPISRTYKQEVKVML